VGGEDLRSDEAGFVGVAKGGHEVVERGLFSLVEEDVNAFGAPVVVMIVAILVSNFFHDVTELLRKICTYLGSREDTEPERFVVFEVFGLGAEVEIALGVVVTKGDVLQDTLGEKSGGVKGALLGFAQFFGVGPLGPEVTGVLHEGGEVVDQRACAGSQKCVVLVNIDGFFDWVRHDFNSYLRWRSERSLRVFHF